jgi:hypothetical protein
MVSSLVGISAAMTLGVLVNVLVARHYTRWDWTRGGLYTLSEATVHTLRGLEEPIRVYVLLPSGDPLMLSIQHLLEAYRSETTRIEVEYTDPDRHPAKFLAVQQRYGVVADKTEDGRILTDASVIVARGDRPHFLTSRDLVEVEDEEDLRARPRLEQALTGAIRSVIATERPRACFTTGHGEKSLDVGGGTGLAAFKDRLIKNNYEVEALGPETKLASCRVLILAAPSEPVPAGDVAQYKAFIEKGGSALLVVGPVPDADDQRYLHLGVGDLLAVAGVRLEEDFIFEQSPKHRSTQGYGETLLPIVRPHPITEGLVKAGEQGLGPTITVASTLAPAGTGPAAAPLLVTSEEAFGMVDFFAWAQNPAEPKPVDQDHKGPLTVAFAAELPKPPSSGAAHGPRVVVVSSPSVLFGANWQSAELRGTAVFMESAVSWLAARPPMLDIPNKPSFTAGLRISEESLGSIFRYVVLYMPLVTLFLGVLVYLQRHGSRRRKKAADAAPPPAPDEKAP